MKSITMFMILILLPATASAFPEKHYQEQWCAEQRGTAEVVLADHTRADCITATHAIEFDFGKKWAEAIGQSLYYSLQTGKRAGVVLILDGSIGCASTALFNISSYRLTPGR
ncbi:MAG: hypothetical protein PF442_09775 [Desulfobulbaceae bacterium]|jgi:hypothetical protein|nr:hypothetical protein [Desulfobulbaceae bacterium]